VLWQAKRISQLLDKVEKWGTMWDALNKATGDEIAYLTAQNELCRKQALEEAAKICDSYHCTAFGPADCAEKIRNLSL